MDFSLLYFEMVQLNWSNSYFYSRSLIYEKRLTSSIENACSFPFQHSIHWVDSMNIEDALVYNICMHTLHIGFGESI